MTTTTTILELTNIGKTYGGENDSIRTMVLNGVDLAIQKNVTLAIVGPSGSGKSTLLNIMGTLDKPTSGIIVINNIDVTQMDDRALAHVRSQQIGFVFQQHFLLPQCTVLENVIVPTLARSAILPKGENVVERAKRLLARVGLSERLNYLPGEISGGEKQRVAVVRALINKPSLLLADEPTGALDRAAADNLASLLVELNQEENVALVLVTHSIELAKTMQTILEVSDGKLVPFNSMDGRS